ncbi:uncharacterized protein CMU_019920 [Cryptosporidium muris RN66]|uniref:Chromodomain-helicase-DNA-binding protein 1-like C-terminal domain-containing protein n=1 Tax=Cryptosporidium muris (strain RN66) TaxID=441375 RepID=B6AJB1_CRYMR|nr:uncharacterized protein CMU_019920 [Cryptosporidium muris RN66]EEA08249.1 hypothetical protein, conserved [Cryptosporidium muris RN66]|eukprot:XP_002142598.1 hypothetical protein [Cryptosporidium muris RN66]
MKKLFHSSNNMADADVVSRLKVLLPTIGDEINEILKLSKNEATRQKVHSALWSYVAKCTVFQPQDIEKIYSSWKGNIHTPKPTNQCETKPGILNTEHLEEKEFSSVSHESNALV